ncbi:MAG: RluA family pseudouridine synthase [Treponema sp.]|nr:RluA family pseudouridine synthase [Treponema sp.]
MIQIFSFKSKKTCRLDILLREELPPLIQKFSRGDISNSKIRRLITAGAVQVNGCQCRIPAELLYPGSSIEASIDNEKFFYEKQPDDIKFEVTKSAVLYEDDVIIVVNKPARFPTEATITEHRDNMHDAVVRWLWSEKPELRNPPYAGIMHRLDRGTSGVLLFTKQRMVNGPVHEMFEQHTAHKMYRAVVRRGNISGKEFFVDDSIGRITVKSRAGKWGIVPESQGGLHAHTDFTLLGEGMFDGIRVQYIEARPLTGRTHQIRVHLSSLGMPIMGDELYGGPAAERIFLHAQSLVFPHPVTGLPVVVTAPLPSGFGSADIP